VHRFLGRLWRLSADVADHTADHPVPDELSPADLELLRKAHWAIDKVTNDMAGRFAFNTAIAAVMELTNTISRRREQGDASPGALRFALGTAASLLFPFAPHTAADAFHRLTGERVWEEPWPAADEAFLESESYELVCQVNGRVRDRVLAPSAAERDELEALCLAAPNVRAHIDGKDVLKVVVVPRRLVNLVVR
jgi:leucyl-tRNA synthetase